MSHYPNSAELARLRGGSHRSIDSTIVYPLIRWELSYGIPTMEAGQRDFGQDPATHSLARWGANDMRRRAWGALDSNAYGCWHPHNIAAFDHEREFGIPMYV